MKFYLVDKIESVELGRRIVTVKALSMAEEYLADHFPAFPVLPGVMMLEALTQSAAWLVRLEQNWANSVIVLSAAKNVRYAHFVQPGDLMRCDLEAMEIGPSGAKFKGTATVGEHTTVTARLELSCFNIKDKAPYLTGADESILATLRKRWELIGGPAAVRNAGSGIRDSGSGFSRRVDE